VVVSLLVRRDRRGGARAYLNRMKQGADPRSGAILHRVIKSPLTLQALEGADRRSALRSLTYYQSLDIFLALCDEARLLNTHMGADWLQDVQCDVEIARTLNARP
jgi:hypothetical protein